MATPIRRAKTSFTAGELAPEMLGRGDLRAWENGARRLRNVFIQPTGGITRRPGTRFVAGVNHFVARFQEQLAVQQAALPWRRRIKRAATLWLRSKGERRRERQYFSARFTLQMRATDTGDAEQWKLPSAKHAASRLSTL